MTTKLRDIPAIRKLAEERARRHVEATNEQLKLTALETRVSEVYIEALLDILTDTSDPYARAMLVVLCREGDTRWRAHYDEENEDWVALGPWPDPEDEAWAPDQPGYYYWEGCDCEEDARHAAMNERDQWWHNIQDDPAALEAELREVLAPKETV